MSRAGVPSRAFADVLRLSSSLASAGNELKLQATGSGLDDLEEEFMDGR